MSAVHPVPAHHSFQIVARRGIKIAFEDVTSVLADPIFFRVLIHKLTSPVFADEQRALIDLQNAQA